MSEAIMENKVKNNITPATILLTFHTYNDFYCTEALHCRTSGKSKKFSHLVKERNLIFHSFI